MQIIIEKHYFYVFGIYGKIRIASLNETTYCMSHGDHEMCNCHKYMIFLTVLSLFYFLSGCTNSNLFRVGE